MHIKQIVISGFKSYKDKTIINDLDPGLNIIVGRNGSGKSNLFAAIEFALTLEYRNLRPLERSALLFGNKNSCEHAYVEITFDNSDRKLAVPSDTATFRRTIGTKKDKFFCNKKELTNAKQFLDMAGFSNPYFIVKQGTVHQLAVGSDAFRLKVISDVAGSSYYDLKIGDCRRSLRAADSKKTKIQELMNRLEERKKELEKDSKELKNFTELDADRRGIEIVLNIREEGVVRGVIEELETEKENIVNQQIPIKSQLTELIQRKQDLNEETENLKRQILHANEKKLLIEGDLLRLIVEKEQLKNQKKDLEKLKTTKKTGENLLKIGKQLNQAEMELKNAEKELELKREGLEGVCRRIISAEIQLKSIEEKLRNDPMELGIVLGTIENELKKTKKTLQITTKEFEDIKKQKDNEMEKLEELNQQIHDITQELSKLQKSLDSPNALLFERQTERSTCYTQLNELDHTLSTEKQIKQRIMEQLGKRVGRQVINGWEGIKNIVKEGLSDGYYGLVVENINCEENFDYAVEVGGGGRLFHHIVSTQSVSLKLMKEFNHRKYSGIVSFIPLDKIHVPEFNYPLERSIKPLITCIDHTPNLKKAVQFVFGKYLLCKSLLDASQISKLYKFDCVTTEGDKVSRGGPMTGGKISNVCQMELIRGKIASECRFNELVLKKEKIILEITFLGEEIKKIICQNEMKESRRSRLDTKKDVLTSQKTISTEKIKSFNNKTDQLSKTIQNLKLKIYEKNCQKSNLQNDNNNSSSQENRANVQNLRKNIKNLLDEKRILIGGCLGAEKIVSEGRRRVGEMGRLQEEEKNADYHNSSQEQKMKMEEFDKIINNLEKQIQKKKEDLECVINLLIEIEKVAISKRTLQIKNSENSTQLKTRLNKLDQKLTQTLSKLSLTQVKLSNSLQNSGTIPNTKNKYEKTDSKTLYKILKKLNKSLKEKDSINQKAEEQFQELNDKFVMFCESIEKIDVEREEIINLIGDLEERKGVGFLKVFRVLKEQFAAIFEEIVGSGRGQLGLVFNCDDDRSDESRVIGSDALKGVKINVNFKSKDVKDMRHILQLSGGQKSVVALCLILAIQKIDPVPFYLFDEVDQALDSQYRGAVTQVIYNMAEEFSLQFICTTFRKEFLLGAHKFFGVSYANKCSSVRQVTKEEAHNFVDEEQASEEVEDMDVD